MAIVIHLSIKDGEVEAIEKGKPWADGFIVANRGSAVIWHDKVAQGTEQFVVKFQRGVLKGGPSGWPFKLEQGETEPVPPELLVPRTGKITKLLKEEDADWWYQVDYKGAKSLDPMMIVRKLNLIERVSRTTIAVVAFLVGALVGMFLFNR